MPQALESRSFLKGKAKIEKGGKDRYVPLLEEVKETINLYIKNCNYGILKFI